MCGIKVYRVKNGFGV